MATGDILLVYGTAADVTITLASLATDANKLIGRGGTAVDNTTLKALDYLASGKITVGTTPTTAKSIEVWVIGCWDGTLWPDAVGASDAGLTITSAEIKSSVCKLVASMPVVATSNREYPFGPVSIAALFGGVVPPKFTFFVVHDTVAALHATAGNHKIRLQPIYQNVA